MELSYQDNNHGLSQHSFLRNSYKREVQVLLLQPFPKLEVFDSSKLKKFADDNIKFDENGRKFEKQVENTVGKKKKKKKLQLASNFSIFHHVFKRLVLEICQNQGFFGKG